MPSISAGLLLYRRVNDAESGALRLEVLLVHPGGPYWAKKDAGAAEALAQGEHVAALPLSGSEGMFGPVLLMVALDLLQRRQRLFTASDSICP